MLFSLYRRGLKHCIAWRSDGSELLKEAFGHEKSGICEAGTSCLLMKQCALEVKHRDMNMIPIEIRQRRWLSVDLLRGVMVKSKYYRILSDSLSIPHITVG